MKDRDRDLGPDPSFMEWFRSLKPVPPEEARKIGKLMDEMIIRITGRPPRLSFTEDRPIVNPGVYTNPAAREIHQELLERIDSGEDSVAILTDWRRHLFAETYGLPKEGYCPPGRCPFHPEPDKQKLPQEKLQ